MEIPEMDRKKDCPGCKLTSFAGLTASAGYVAYHAKMQPTVFGKSVLSIFAFGLGYTGFARLVNFYPFSATSQKRQEVD